jgi:hypothetical protein
MLIRFTCFPRVANGGPPASVRWHTADGSAHGGIFPGVVTVDDYLVAANVPGFPVTFQPGVGEQNGIITTISDDCLENNETFRIVLTNPVSAFLQRGVATFTLLNEDTTCREPIFGTLLDSCLCNGFLLGTVDAIPADATTTVGASLPYGIQWTVPSPASWRSLQSMDIRLTELATGESADQGPGGSGPDDTGTVLTVSWDEAANTFSMLDPLTGALIRSRPTREQYPLRDAAPRHVPQVQRRGRQRSDRAERGADLRPGVQAAGRGTRLHRGRVSDRGFGPPAGLHARRDHHGPAALIRVSPRLAGGAGSQRLPRPPLQITPSRAAPRGFATFPDAARESLLSEEEAAHGRAASARG